MIERRLYHCSSHPFNASVGTKITLKPGNQAAQGKGVYFSLGVPDIRASDSVHSNGLNTIFSLLVTDSKKNWYTSKGCRDKAKNRPQTWHSKGAEVVVEVTSVNVSEGVTYIEGVGNRAS